MKEASEDVVREAEAHQTGKIQEQGKEAVYSQGNRQIDEIHLNSLVKTLTVLDIHIIFH